MPPPSTIHLPLGTLEEQGLARLDRLALFVSAKAELAHLTHLMREVERAKADLEESIPILDRSATRLARAFACVGRKMKPAIQCKYSCAECGIVRRLVTVPARAAETVADWLEKVAVPVMVRDHAQRSPGCAAGVFSEVLVPSDADTPVGALPKAKGVQ